VIPAAITALWIFSALGSSISPVAIRATITAAPITSAGASHLAFGHHGTAKEAITASAPWDGESRTLATTWRARLAVLGVTHWREFITLRVEPAFHFENR